MLLPAISERLGQVRNRIRRVFWINGLIHSVIFLAVFSIATFIIDWSVPDLPKGVRISFLVIGFITLVYFVFKYLAYPLRKPITDEDIAICVERFYPELKERLISSLQLGKTLENPHGCNSPELIRLLVTEANEVATPLDFSKIISTQQMAKLFAVAGSLLVIIVLYCSFYPSYANIWFNRMLIGDARWPKKTMLEVSIKSEVIAKGQDFNLTVLARKGSPKKVYVYYEFETGESGWERMGADENDDKKFTYDFRQVHNSFTFYVQGGDDRTDPKTIQVLTPPRLEKIQAWYDYPPYTKLSNTPASQPEEGGLIHAPYGTDVKLIAFANIPLTSAKLLLGESDLREIAIENDILNEPKKMSMALKVGSAAEYIISLKAQNGLENLESVRYPIKAIADTAPTIKIIEPKKDAKQVTSNAEVPVILLTTDDYGVNRISLFYKIQNREAPEEKSVLLTDRHNGVPYGSPRIESNYIFNIVETGVKEGDVIGYQIEAEDNCAISATNITRTREFKFMIVDAAQLQKRIEEIELRIKEEVKKTLQLQTEIKDEFVKSKDTLLDNEAFSQPEKRCLQKNQTEQRRIVQILDRVGKEFDEIISDIVINKLWDTTTSDKLKLINGLIKDAGENKSTQASDAISKLANLPDPSRRETIYNGVLDFQSQVIQNLGEALAKMEEWEDYQEVVRVVRELLQKQNKIIQELKE
ncbi:MAG: hypothetical protein HY811_11010 [Planctomycetes bacterium]|nr:hypothetical protein [Planctomycetota bacterium]